MNISEYGGGGVTGFVRLKYGKTQEKVERQLKSEGEDGILMINFHKLWQGRYYEIR